MKKIRFCLLVVVLLVFILSVQAQDIGGNCVEDIDCLDPANSLTYSDCNEDICYCDEDTNHCFLDESLVGQNNNTSTNQTQNNTTTADQKLLSELERKISVLEEQQKGSSNTTVSVQKKLSSLETKSDSQYSALRAQQNTNAQTIINLQDRIIQLETDILAEENEVNTLATGLAGLQQNLGETQTELDDLEVGLEKEQDFTKLIKIIFFTLLVIAVTLMIIVFITRKSSMRRKVDGKVISYITTHIKKGQKYPQIKAELLRAGWSVEDIKLAYKETTKRNYQDYLQKSGKSSGKKKRADYDRNKVLAISAFSILIVIGLLFLIRGITTGKAIAFENEQQLGVATSTLLNLRIDKNDFYPLIKFANLCVEIHDRDKSVSYKILKTPSGHLIEKVNVSCSADDNYDASVKFSTWSSFNIVSRNTDCKSFELQHGKNGFSILPSKFILPGFRLNPSADVSPFCSALSLCLDEEELLAAGINC